MSGHIRRRGTRSFELKYDAGSDPLTGKRRIRYVSFKGTHRDAKLELARLVAKESTGQATDPSKTTFAGFLDRWEQDWAALHTSPKTFERYTELLRHHVRPHIGHVRLQRLQPVMLADLYAKLVRESGLAARTVGHVHRVTRRALGHAVQWNLLASNPADRVRPPKVEVVEVEVLRSGDVQTLLAQLGEQRNRLLHTITVVLLATGLRRGELCALRWQDVDLDAGVLAVERSLEQTRQYGLRFKAPKTKHSRRKVSLSPAAVAELRLHRKTQQEMRLRLGQGRLPDDALVFADWNGEVRNPDTLSKTWAHAMKKIGMAHITLHSLRHTNASTLIASGLDVLTISRRLGHSSPTITLGVYGHLIKPDDRAAEILQAAFGPHAGV